MADNFQQVIQLAFEVLGEADAQRVADVLQGVGDSGSKADAQLGPLIEKFQQLAEQSALVDQALDLSARLEKNQAALERAKQGLADLNDEFTRTDKSSADITVAFAQAQKQVTQLAAEQLKLQNASAAVGEKLKDAGVDVTALGAAHDELKTKTAAAADELTKAADAANKTHDAHKHAADGAGEHTTAVGTLRKALTDATQTTGEFIKKLFEITGIAAVVSSALSTISGFRFFEKGVEEARAGEVALAKLRAAVAGNAETFEQLKTAAEHAAESVGTTSIVAVETLTKLTAQLGNADAAAKALPATLTLAKAAQIDFNEAAELVATTLKAFGLEAGRAGEIADKLAAIASRTGVNLAELSRAAAQVAPLAKEAGIGFDSVAAALAELSSKGFEAQKSNAGLRELFIALGQSGSKLRQDLVGLGIDTSSLGSILEGLRNAGTRGTEALQTLSVKGRAAVSALVQGGSADLQHFQQVLDESGGSAGKTAKLLGDTFDGALKSFGRTVDSLADDVVKGSLPAVEGEIRKLNDELKDVGKSDLFKTLKESVKDFVAGAVAAFDEFVHKFDWKGLSKDITDWSSSAKKSFDSFTTGFEGVGRIVQGIGGAIGVVFHAILTVFNAFAASTSDVLSILSTVAAKTTQLANALHLVSQATVDNYKDLQRQYLENSQKFSANTDKEIDALVQSLGKLGTAVIGAGDSAKAQVPKHEEHAKSLQDTGDAARKLPTDLDNAIRALATLQSVGTTSGVAVDALKNLIAQLRGETQKLPSALEQANQDLSNATEALAALERAGITSGTAVDSLQDLIVQLTEKNRSLTPSVYETAAAFGKAKDAAGLLKITLQDDLVKTADEFKNAFETIDKTAARSAAGLADRREAFIKFAEAALAATKNLDEGAKNQTRYTLENKASALGLTDQLGKLELQYLGVGSSANQASGNIAAGGHIMDEAAVRAKKLADEIQRMGDENLKLEDRVAAADNAIKLATLDTQKQTLEAERASIAIGVQKDASAALAAAASAVQASFKGVSEAAGEKFTEVMDRASANAGFTKLQVQDLTKSLGALNAAAADTTGFGAYFKALAGAQETVRQEIDAQRQSLQAQITAFQDFANSGTAALDSVGRVAGLTLEQMKAMDAEIKNGTFNTGLLGKQELAPLQAALQATIAKTEALQQAAQSANQQFQSLAQSIHDSLLQEQGNQAALEDERHKNLDDQLKALKDAGKVSEDQYQKAISDENQLHQLKMKNIADQAKAQAQQNTANNNSASAANNSAGKSNSPPPPSLPNSQLGQPTTGLSQTVTINANVYGSGSPEWDKFVRDIGTELQRIANLSK